MEISPLAEKVTSGVPEVEESINLMVNGTVLFHCIKTKGVP
jgi:hypothetical protein